MEQPPPCLLTAAWCPLSGSGHLLALHTKAKCSGMWSGDITYRVTGSEPGPQPSHESASRPLEAPPSQSQAEVPAHRPGWRPPRAAQPPQHEAQKSGSEALELSEHIGTTAEWAPCPLLGFQFSQQPMLPATPRARSQQCENEKGTRSPYPETEQGPERRSAFNFLPRKPHHSEPRASRATLFLK